jgi:dihydrofolate reductase
VSNTLEDPLPWQNSTLLKGDAAVTVAQLKQQSNDLVVLGSVALVQSLMRHNLVDEYVLSIHPLVLGSGRRLFPDGVPYATLNFDRQQDNDHRGRDGRLSACLLRTEVRNSSLAPPR